MENYFDKATKFVDDNIKSIQYGLYGAFCVGGAMLFRNMHLFKKFKNVKEIPRHFIDKSIALRGLVKDIPTGSTMRVEHVPVIKVPLLRRSGSDDYLLVKLAGIAANNEVKKWLEVNAVGREIKFKPLLVQDYNIHSSVKLTRKKFFNTTINEDFITGGLTRVDSGLDLDKVTATCEDVHDDNSKDTLRFRIHQQRDFWQYIDKLLVLEVRADKKRKPFWKLWKT